jgi:hypothetical protein
MRTGRKPCFQKLLNLLSFGTLKADTDFIVLTPSHLPAMELQCVFFATSAYHSWLR